MTLMKLRNFFNRNDNIENKTSGSNSALETKNISKWLNSWDLHIVSNLIHVLKFSVHFKKK